MNTNSPFRLFCEGTFLQVFGTNAAGLIGADGKTASVLENSNAIASAGNSTLEPSASERNSNASASGSEHTSQPATELAASGASESHRHQWLQHLTLRKRNT
jgi:hypothetical protein